MTKAATVERTIEGQLFHCGTVQTTATAVRAAHEAGVDLDVLLRRHAQGNTGQMTTERAAKDRIAPRCGSTVVSAHRARSYASPFTFIFETDIGRRKTRILLESEYLQAPSPEPPAPSVQAVLGKEAALHTERDQVAAAIPRVGLEEARTAEAEAQSHLAALVVDDATGRATPDQVKAAEQELEAARSATSSVARTVETLEARLTALDREREDVAREREQAEQHATQERRRADAHLADLIERHDRDAARVRALTLELGRVLEGMAFRAKELTERGACVNPSYFAGCGQALERTARGEPAETGDTNPWETF
jgi:hypothetical protein